jgi:hypothetical protein
VPVQIEATKIEREHKPSKRKSRAETDTKKPQREKESVKEVEQPEVETPKVIEQKTERPEDTEARHQDSEEAESAHHKEVRTLPEDEVIVPLEENEFEEEVFVSDRWRNQAETKVPKVEEEPVQESTDTSQQRNSEQPTSETTVEDEEEKPETPLRPRTQKPFNTSQTAASAQSARPPVTPSPTPPRTSQPNNAPQQQSSISSIWNRYFPSQGPTAANQAPASPNVAPQPAGVVSAPTPPRTPEYRSGRVEQRYLLTGLIIGGLIEHIRHKRREKRQERHHKKTVEKLDKRQDALESQLQHETQNSQREKTALERTIERLQRHTTDSKETVGSRTMDAIPTTAATALPEQKSVEAPSVASSPEARKEKERLAALAAVEAAYEEQETQLPPDRRLETSAWHRIEVDKKTGNAVETPTVAYGEEFKHEKHPEQLRTENDNASQDAPTVFQEYPQQISGGKTADPQGSHALPARASKGDDQSGSRMKDVAEEIRYRASQVPPLDIALWALLVFIILAIIAVL